MERFSYVLRTILIDSIRTLVRQIGYSVQCVSEAGKTIHILIFYIIATKISKKGYQ